MNYADIKNYDTANGLGIRVSLFVSGCTHKCEGCFNQEAWDFSFGKKYTKETQDEIISYCNKDYIKGLSLLGGEPFELANQEEVKNLVLRFKKEFPNKDVWAYSGYLFDKDMVKDGKVYSDHITKILENIDILVDGEFVIKKKNLSLKFRGSENQRIIDVKKSLATGKTICIPDEDLV